MSKIIIVGHPDSGHTQIEDHLFLCGMKPPKPSCRDELAATEVIATICKAMQLPSVADVDNLDHFKQHTPGPVWDGLLLDLLRSNLDHDLWGWADSQAVFLLDYLARLDPKLVFILVYDSPKNLLLKSCHNLQNSASESPPQKKLDHWTAYNTALLHFYLRNKKNCILINSKSAQLSTEQYFSMLQARFDAALHVAEPLDKVNTETTSIPTLPSQDINEKSLCDGKLLLSNLPSHLGVEDFFAKDTESYILDHYLLQEKASRQIYEELQASSNLPSEPDASASLAVTAAWTAFLKQRWFSSELVGRIYKDRQILTSEIQQLTESQTSLQDQIRLRQEALASCRLALQQQRTYNGHSASVQKLLIDELHQAQEELMRLAKENTLLKQPPAPYGAVERIKSQLCFRLGKIMIKRSKSLIGIIRMPYDLIAEAQKFKREQSTKITAQSQPMHTYADALLAEQMKKQLSYRLGSVMVYHSKSLSGWLSMPLSIIHELQQFRSDQKQSNTSNR